jgi:hypothetical protein
MSLTACAPHGPSVPRIACSLAPICEGHEDHVEKILLNIFFILLIKRETHPHNVRLPFPKMRDTHSYCASPFNLRLHGLEDCINLVATEKRNLETVKVKLPDLLYLTIVHDFVLARNIISFNIHHYSDMSFSYLIVQCRTCIHLCRILDMS